MRNLFFPVLLAWIIGCLSCTSRNNAEPASHIHSDSISMVTPGMATIDKIMSVSWIEIEKRKVDWTLVSPCGAAIPAIRFRHDTLDMNHGNGRVDLYKIKSAAFGKRAEWNFHVLHLHQDSVRLTDTLTISVLMLDRDKAHWQIGNDDQFDFLDDQFVNNYPKEVVDCE